MTNLTEQWNKDKLKDGFYYVAIDEPFMPKKVEIIEYYKTGFETDMDSNYMHEVLAEVPSYELWKAVHEQWKVLLEENKRLKHDVGNLGYKIKNQRKEIDNRLKEIEKLKERNDSLNNRDINLCRIANGIRDENFALKEQLKECKERLIYCTISTQDVQAKINQVLANNQIQANTLACNKIQENNDA